MTDPDDTAPPSRPASGGDADPPAASPAPRPELRERVRRQRRHIEELTGQDPLRGGIDD